MDTAAQPQSDSPTYRDAAQRTRSFLNHPLRVGSAVGIFTAVGTLVALIKAQLLGTWWWLVALALLVLIIVAVAAADRSSPSAQRPPLLSEPSRENPQELSARSILGLVGFFVMLYGVGAVASALSSSAAVYPITIGLTLLIAIIITWLGGFGMAPLAKPLPSDFTQHYPYPADSPQARILAVLEVSRGWGNNIFFTDRLPYFAQLHDAELTEALRTLASDGYLQVRNNSSALTEKGRARKFVQLADAASPSEGTTPTQ